MPKRQKTSETARTYRGQVAAKHMSDWGHDSLIVDMDYKPNSRGAKIHLQNGQFLHQYLSNIGDAMNVNQATINIIIFAEQLENLRIKYSLTSCDCTQKRLFIQDKRLEVQGIQCKKSSGVWQIKFSTFGVVSISLSCKRLWCEETVCTALSK